MKITVIGTGYVGLPTGVGLAELGNEVVCLDIDEKKINTLKSGKVTIFEEGLEELFQKNTANGKVRFSTSFAESIPAIEAYVLLNEQIYSSQIYGAVLVIAGIVISNISPSSRVNAVAQSAPFQSALPQKTPRS